MKDGIGCLSALLSVICLGIGLAMLCVSKGSEIGLILSLSGVVLLVVAALCGSLDWKDNSMGI